MKKQEEDFLPGEEMRATDRARKEDQKAAASWDRLFLCDANDTTGMEPRAAAS